MAGAGLKMGEARWRKEEGRGERVPVGNRRYSRLPIGATPLAIATSNGGYGTCFQTNHYGI